MAFCEVSQDQSPGTPAAAGDFGFKVLTSSDPAEKTEKLSAELAILGQRISYLHKSAAGDRPFELKTNRAVQLEALAGHPNENDCCCWLLQLECKS